MVAPYNSQAANPWTSTDPSGNIVFRDYAAVPDCIWMFPGSGTDFPLQPGEDAVVAYHGVDHTQTYSQSVNLNRKGCFVLYDMVYYPGNKLHPTPVPGDQIDQAHYMKVLKKTGTNTAVVYVISQNSPAVILFRAPKGSIWMPIWPTTSSRRFRAAASPIRRYRGTTGSWTASRYAT